VLGIFLFLCELAILCWVKFYDYSIMAAASATIIMVPVLILFMGFAVHFYHKLVVHKYELTESGLRECEQLKNQLDSNSDPPNSNPNNVSIV
jgi:calcium release-activated calcium channel protein 1